MKTMRYRIRVIVLLLVTALLATALWCTKEIWFPAGIAPTSPVQTASPSVSPSASPAPSSTTHVEWWETPVPSPAEETSTPEPLFNTFGL